MHSREYYICALISDKTKGVRREAATTEVEIQLEARLSFFGKSGTIVLERSGLASGVIKADRVSVRL